MVLSSEGTSVALAGALSVKAGSFCGQPGGTVRRVSKLRPVRAFRFSLRLEIYNK